MLTIMRTLTINSGTNVPFVRERSSYLSYFDRVFICYDSMHEIYPKHSMSDEGEQSEIK